MKHIKRITLISFVALFIAAIAFTSCTSNRKCNGNRGIKTPMGNM